MSEPALSIDIKHAHLLKHGEVALITAPDGAIQPNQPGFGLFHRDTRYLSRYEVRIDRAHPLLLSSSAAPGYAADMELTNPHSRLHGNSLEPHAIGMHREFLLLADSATFIDLFSLRSFARRRVDFILQFRLSCGFESILTLRGSPLGRRGRLHKARRGHGALQFQYDGADGISRRLQVRFSQVPVHTMSKAGDLFAEFWFCLSPQEQAELVLAHEVSERRAFSSAAANRKGSAAPEITGDRVSTPTLIAGARERIRHEWGKSLGRVISSDPALNEALNRSFTDRRLLSLERDGMPCIAAGLPWFLGLFGRDSLIPALQFLAYDRRLAADTARVLARYQGTKVDSRRREEPGKILHELRVGEKAHLHEIAETPSYFSIDSTLLWLILIAEEFRWTGSIALFEELRQGVERALRWAEEFGDRNRDGYLEYRGTTTRGTPVNQGWRDSADGVIRDDGTFPRSPISLCEVQGYWYLARVGIASLYERVGDRAAAERLREQAAELKRRFNRDFWMESAGCYCLGLERGGRQISVVTSNAGQVLWTGIADDDKAARTAQRLMRDDVFSGFGIRTLSSLAVSYHPFAYQRGSVWPFDTSLVLAGFRRYGFDAPADRLFQASLVAATAFPLSRLPEFFAGNRRVLGQAPAHCPRADPLQAWSTGAFPYMLSEMLGLRPDGAAGVLRVIRPVLPPWVSCLEIKNLEVGAGRLSLRFTRNHSGQLCIEEFDLRGALTLDLEEAH